MNAGFSSLKFLKRHLLAEPQRAEVSFNDEILALGLGVAASMETYCDRQFARVVGATWITPGSNRTTFVFPRYPIESITGLEMRTRSGEAWEARDPDELILETIGPSGVVILDTPLGGAGVSLRWTWTGGLWWDTTEDDSGTLPANATALPADLRQAWLLQCQEIWSRRDNLGMGLTLRPTERAKLSELDLVPAVRAMLRPHTRHAS